MLIIIKKNKAEKEMKETTSSIPGSTQLLLLDKKATMSRRCKINSRVEANCGTQKFRHDYKQLWSGLTCVGDQKYRNIFSASQPIEMKGNLFLGSSVVRKRFCLVYMNGATIKLTLYHFFSNSVIIHVLSDQSGTHIWSGE